MPFVFLSILRWSCWHPVQVLFQDNGRWSRPKHQLLLKLMLKQVCDLLAFYVGLVHLKAASAGAGCRLAQRKPVEDIHKSACGVGLLDNVTDSAAKAAPEQGAGCPSWSCAALSSPSLSYRPALTWGACCREIAFPAMSFIYLLFCIVDLTGAQWCGKDCVCL